MNNRTIVMIALLAVVMILGTANAVNVTAIYGSDENNSVSPCRSCSGYQANGTFSEERGNDTHAENVSLGNSTNLTGSVCDDNVPMKVNITSHVGMNESTVDLSVTNDNTTVATDVIRDGAVVNETASMASALPASEGMNASSNAEIAHSAIHEYTGAANCRVCHKHTDEYFATSIHNTWQGIATNITGKEGNVTGKLVGVNEFCGAVTSNEAMCGKCHAGFGLPEGDISVDKIDCLICHAPNYKKTATGPDPSITISEVTPGIRLPTREYCLRCHATAGGGDNRKRGDLELAMGAANVSNDLDVHMGGQNMTCQNCHIFDDYHHVSGRGMDLRVDDTDTIVSCEQCHSSDPHPEGPMYNQHMDRIACTACHITSYGKEHPVEVSRNWELPFLPGMRTEVSNPAPIHVWWNRTSEIMDLADQVVLDDGVVVMAKPGGDINDSDSKIYAARLHLGRSPWNGTYMLPFNVPTAKATNNMTQAIFNATGVIYDPVQYVNATRYMGLFHGVSPKVEALTCNDCHKDHKLDYEALGYNVTKDASGNLISATKPGSTLNLLDFGEGGHELLIDEYNGSETCLACHAEHGDDFVTSIHNTWQGIATNVIGKEGNTTGKRVAINEFCGAVTSNEAMCGKCHAGYGLTEGDFSVEKIDCLICHAPNYNKTATGPGPLVNATAAAQGVELPTREYCLRCHATAGGGDNRKRGDLELVMGESNVSKDLDVHMSANMTCQECHTFEDHHVSGRGMDLRVDDTDTIVSCEGCHNVAEPPHPEGSMYNQHMDRIACTACHITSYGKVHPVEVSRNWELPFLSGMRTEVSNPAPIHVWWNRTSEIMDLADRAVFDSDGNVVMAKPGGDINDSESKIYAARLHLGRSPWNGTHMLPFNVPTASATHNMTQAIFNATGVTYDPVEYVNSTRYMGLFHGVSPKEDALTCSDCHKDHKLDYEALGYNVKKDASGNLTSVTKPGSTLNLLDFGEGGHTFIDEYTGSETCLECHEKQGDDFNSSIHNTWQGIATNVVGKEGNTTGKRVAVNEFCGAVTSNEAMCGKCHAGYGLTEGDFSVEKIDCLICHAPNYKKNATGPDPSINATAAAQGVGLPTREMCLRCHATAGGGDNRKRGDLELAMGASSVSEDLDVHMSTDMTCQDCHTFEDHHVSGRGMDLRVDDTTTVVSCDDAKCHGSEPHPTGSLYNRHTDNISCTACHITSYGKVHPVEVSRNWELPFLSGMRTEVSKPAPIHVWWNRTSEIMDLADLPVFDSDGNVVMAKPGGDINDSESKIYAARLHRGRSPWDGTYMLPFNVPTANATKNMTEAILVATGETHYPVQYVNSTRYLGLFHGVSPKEDALTCGDCHDDHKLNYTALGYNVEKDASGNLINATKPGIDWNLATLAAGSGEAAEVAIRDLPATVSKDEVFTATINTSDYGTSAQVNETLPSGFTYLASSLDSSQVTSLGGNMVRFNLTGETSFTYTVEAPGTPGVYDFSGTITDASDVVTDIGGDSSITVGAAPSIAEIADWTLPSTGTCGAIDATVTVKNTGTETTWFVVSVAGTSTTGKSISGLGTVELGAATSKVVHVKVQVDAVGTYTLIPDVYLDDGYPESTLQATGSGDTIVIS